jgi:transmembrane sensor
MTPRPSEVTRQAAEWVVQLRAPDAPVNCEAQFAAWLCASPLHVREYLAAVEVWQCLADPSIEPGSSRDELIEDAGTSGVIDFPSRTDSRAPAARPPRSRRLLGAALAATVLLLFTLTYVSWRYYSPAEITTAIGEQRSAVLPDHSIVELNTQSTVRIAYTSRERRIDLVRGEAFFEVAKDPNRPFIVATEWATARALGTRFTVYRAPTGTVVTVAEGRVLVRYTDRTDESGTGRTGPIESVEVVPGTQADATPGNPVRVHPVDVDRSLAWRNRRLVFAGETLANVVREFNRYNVPRLEIVDPRLLDQRISGVFGANDPRSLLDFLSQVDHIDVSHADPDVIRIGDPMSERYPLGGK